MDGKPTEMTKLLKVLLISRSYGQHAGGMERLSYELIDSVSQLPEIEATAIVNNTPAGASLMRVRLQSLLFITLIAPRAIWAARTADVVHLGDPLLSKIGWFIQKLWHKPVTVTVHGLDVQYSNPLYRLYLRFFFRNFDAYIAISEHAKEALLRWRVAGTIHVIPPGIHDRLHDPTITREQLTDLLKTDISHKVVLLTAGRLVARKGHAWFITNVLPLLPEHFIYVIAGDGQERSSIEQAVKQDQLQNRVIMLGRVSNDTLRTLYNTVDIFIQPNIPMSTDAEGFGIVLTEAALCDRIVIAANIDGIPAAIHDKKNGYLVEAQQASRWRDVVLAAQKLPNAREYTLTQFSWDKISQQYRSVFQQLSQTEETV
ncbi:MAG: glycosyltransferase family 4 protein [Candidatus Andersenbacteria bacterium]